MYRKGYSFERALKLELENDGWKVIRSGGSKKPDIIAGRNGKVIVIECKSTCKAKLYLEKAEVDNLKDVALAFGAECMYAVRVDRKKWSLVNLSELKPRGNSYFIDLDAR